MAVTNRDVLRLLLGDPETDARGDPLTPFFSNDDLDDMLGRNDDDPNVAASEGWRMKAAHYASSAYNVTLDGGTFQREALYQHAIEMAVFYEETAGAAAGAVTNVREFGPSRPDLEEATEF